MSDGEALAAMDINRSEDVLTIDMKEKFKADWDELEAIKDKKERKKQFNLKFNTMANEEDEDAGQDMMLYNGNTTLMDKGTASTANYDTMYSGENIFEDQFKINSAHLHEELDERSYEEQMAEYHNAFDDYDAMAKKSKLNNGRADFGSDYV